MTRQVLLALLLIAPTALYIAFAWWQRRRAVAAGLERPPPLWENTPWFWLVLSGFGLFAVALVLFAILGGAPAGSEYVPPRMEDGEVVPGHFITDDQ
ncbi:MAG: DUF6111 family protein [Pseudomonadota bacterium]